MRIFALICALWLGLPQAAPAQTPTPAFDAELARQTGADERGMRRYVFVLLRTGPTRTPEGPERDEMFKGHFANIASLAAQGKLAVAGPYDGVEGWRGMFILAAKDLEEARALVGADPVIQRGEMVAEFHVLYASAALMLVPGQHDRLVAPRP